jgi:uncharacterized membrane protein
MAFRSAPFFTDDFIVLGILLAVLGVIFYTSYLKSAFWKRFYTIFPSLLLCYLVPAILSALGIISPDWHVQSPEGTFLTNADGTPVTQSLSLYKMASRMLLPASLILLTLSIDIKALTSLGKNAIVMFLAGTLGVIIGGPVALWIMLQVSPDVVAGAGSDALWRGLSTIAGSWIGGGANQSAMLEIYQYNPQKFGSLVVVDILVANFWMAILLYGIGKKEHIDNWLGGSNDSIDQVQQKVSQFTASITRMPTLKDYMVLLGATFGAVAFSHWAGNSIPAWLTDVFPAVADKSSPLSTFADSFFWMVTVATVLGVLFSFTPLKNMEGIGASKIGTVFIYILVATIGMKMELKSIVDNPALLVLGAIWMSIHILVLIIVAKLIKAPYFFLAVGSQANIGGAASAPVVASAFHSSLASVGVLLAIFGYIIGTYGAIVSAMLMQWIYPGN